MFDSFDNSEEMRFYTLPIFNREDELFPNLDVGLRPHKQSFELGEQLVDIFDNERAEELVDFEVVDLLTFLFNQHLIVDDLDHSILKLLRILFLPEENSHS